MKISIVTICYNEAECIAETMESVFSQTYKSIEYVIKDGGSTDGTQDRISDYCEKHKGVCGVQVQYIEGKDRGLYDGMNVGLSCCTGDYVLFCNAGDRFVAHDVIEKMVDKAVAQGGADFVFGDSASEIKGRLMVRTAHGVGFLRIGMPAAHEAMMYNLKLVRQLSLKYDISYCIAADYKFTYEFIKAAKSFAYVQVPVIVFSEGGVSTVNRWRGLFEANRVRSEVGEMTLPVRILVAAMQTFALLISALAGPLYRAVRLKHIR